MLEQVGDFWSTKGDAHVITTNGNVTKAGRCIMGRGLALEARTMFPGLALRLGSLIQSRGNHVHYLGTWPRNDTTYNLFSFPVKHNYWEKASLALIKDSAEELAFQVLPIYQRIIMVRPGCGNGGRGWSVVKPIVSLLDNRFIIVERNP